MDHELSGAYIVTHVYRPQLSDRAKIGALNAISAASKSGIGGLVVVNLTTGAVRTHEGDQWKVVEHTPASMPRLPGDA